MSRLIYYHQFKERKASATTNIGKNCAQALRGINIQIVIFLHKMRRTHDA